MSVPLSEQRKSAEAVKGAGKEKEDFFPALTVSDNYRWSNSRAVTEKNTLFRWAGRPAGPKPMP